ncbi:MAG: glycosyltransferase family 39 protein [Lacunisphaera sp.]|nr:glycosyltransferase family 39 protein [Lacunisphaera sp.]
MNDFPTVVLLIANAAVVAVAVGLLVRWLGPDVRGPLEPGLAWGLAGVALVAGAGVLLGAAGGLGAAGFFTAHAAVLVALGWGRRRHRAGDRAAFAGLLARWREIIAARDATAGLTAGLLAGWMVLALLAAFAQPVVYDALTYRLSRVGLWLQDGHIGHYLTDDPRLNYMPVVPDLMMAWLMGAGAEGYRLTGLAQAGGGALLLGATAGLARLTGLNRAASLGAAGLLFAMTSVGVQFTSVHTDVFTAGVLAAAFYLWWAALRRGHGSRWGGVGAGLAFGSKGTLFYFAPGALLWVGWLAWRHRAAWREWRRTLLAGLVGVAVFTGPVFWRNFQSYGGMLGPAAAVELHHGGRLTLAQQVEKLGLNLATSAIQLLDPNAQPPGLHSLARKLETTLALHLPTADPYAFENNNRREWIQHIAALENPDADVVSCGVVVPVFFLAGLLTAVGRRRQPAAGLVLLWGGGVMLFVVTMNGMLRWHPWIFRFLALAAPWLAVVAAYGIEGLSKWFRRGAWGVAGLAGLTACWAATMHTPQVGWSAAIRPERTLSHFIYQQWRDWTGSLQPTGLPLTVALPINRPLAAFCRLDGGGRVQLAHEIPPGPGTAEEFLRDKAGWIVVPAVRFMGREGRVHGRVYRNFGQDGHSPYGLAAYRQLQPGEKPPPLLYRSLRTNQPQGVTDDLLVRSWSGSARLRLHNPSAVIWHFALLAPDDRREGVLAPGEAWVVELRVPSDQVAQVLVVLTHQAAAAGAPSVELRP